MTAKDDLGRAGEDAAARYLIGLGYSILDRNWRCVQGEIDIVARSGPYLAVVEVKTRSSERFGHPFEAIDARKRRRLWHLANAWRASHPQAAAGLMMRLEAVGITGSSPRSGEIEHLVDLV